MNQVSVTCPGSCGELFQGVCEDEEFLVSYKINRRSSIHIFDRNTIVNNTNTDKINQAKNFVNVPKTIQFIRKTQLPIGKGCSSSTADIVTFLQGISAYNGQTLSNDRLTQICTYIEPTDSIAFSNWTAINPLNGKKIMETTWQPNLYVYMLEPMTCVSTSALVRMPDSLLYDNKESSQLLKMFQKACVEQNIELVGEIAIFSALLNNERLPKPYLDEIISFSKRYNLVGVNVAHSGTVVGLLMTEACVDYINELEEAITKELFATYYQRRTLCQIIYEGVQYKKVAI